MHHTPHQAPIVLPAMGKDSSKKLLENIRVLRAKRGLSQENMAEELEMDKSNYGKIERGDVSLTLEKIDKIAEVLEVSTIQLMSGDVEMIASDSEGDYSSLKKRLEKLEADAKFWKEQYAELSVEHLALQKRSGSKKGIHGKSAQIQS